MFECSKIISKTVWDNFDGEHEGSNDSEEKSALETHSSPV